MIERRIIKIDEDKCNGCGLCVSACHEGAIKLIDNKAKLIRDDYCDGLGDCLPSCPVGAISFENRLAKEYDEIAVKKNMEENKKKMNKGDSGCQGGGCPSKMAKLIIKDVDNSQDSDKVKNEVDKVESKSMLRQWPVQINLVPANAQYFDGANLLISADCCAYSYANFHNEFMKNKITLIGCPKLDDCDYSQKLTQILTQNNIKSVTVVKMSVPCCQGIKNAVVKALQNSGKIIPWQVYTITTDGQLLEE